MSKVAIVKKLSGKVLVGNVKTYVKDLQEGQSVELFQVVGIARKIKTGISNFGEWEALMGEFVAEALVGAKAGQRYRTGQLFLPDVALNLVASELTSGNINGIQLGFKVGAMVDETSSTGYVYTAEFLMEPEENDPLESLIAKALPAPEKKPEKTKETPKA